MIFVDLRVFPNFGISNGKLGVDFLLPNFSYRTCHLYSVAGGCRGSPISTTPIPEIFHMVRTERPHGRWRGAWAEKASIITLFVI